MNHSRRRRGTTTTRGIWVSSDDHGGYDRLSNGHRGKIVISFAIFPP